MSEGGGGPAIDNKIWTVGEGGEVKLVERKGLVGERERGRREGPEMQSTLASFTEQATLTHREGDYREGKAG